ncbi:MAG TPA: glycosyltransferase [Iamia sp.]|nr:glycosyltransferase [Iamia sp.]
MPRVSVVIPTRDRHDLLDQALRALDRQRWTDMEVVVVDDGSSPPVASVFAGRTVAGRPLRVLRQEGNGAVRARRAGIAATTGEILAFTDSDCEPQPGWLEAAMARIDAGADLVAGRTRPFRPVAPLERAVSEAKGGLFPSCNLVVRRSVYEAVGGFDATAAERWGFRWTPGAKGLGFGEDTLFGWTVARSHRAVYEPDALVLHRVFPPDRGEWFGRSWQMAAFPALAREVPELRGPLIRRGGQLSHRDRYGFYATVATAALTRRAAPTAVIAAGWAAHRFQQTLRRAPIPLADRVRALPAQMAIDAIQGTALLVGSARARTLVH